jgi:hypothetical protein
MRDPKRVEGCEILLDPARKSTLPIVVEGFLEARLSHDQRNVLAQAVRGAQR